MKFGNKGLTKGATIGIAAGSVVAIGAVATAVILVIGGKNAFRNISVIDVVGQVKVARENVDGEMDAYVNMNLESGDNIEVGADSELDMVLDEDKYVYVEENTKMSLVAEGDSENSKTVIYLNEGAQLHKLDSKLNDQSTYEIETPNATMAIRGTVTSVHVYKDEEGEVRSDFLVYEGKTTVKLHTTEGEQIDEEVTIEAGYQVKTRGASDFSEVIVQQVGTSEMEVAPIEYNTLSSKLIKKLKKISEEEDRPIYVGGKKLENNEIEEILEEVETIEQSQEVEQQVEKSEEPAEATDTSEQTAGEVTEEEPVAEEPAAVTPTKKPVPQPTPEVVEPVPQPVPQPQPTPEPTPEEEEKEKYSVTFLYDDDIFAQQTVEEGEKAKKPKLQPEENGAWGKEKKSGEIVEFDFDTAIKKDTNLIWISAEEEDEEEDTEETDEIDETDDGFEELDGTETEDDGSEDTEDTEGAGDTSQQTADQTQTE